MNLARLVLGLYATCLTGLASAGSATQAKPRSRLDPSEAFVEVRGAQLVIGDRPYHYIGANFWYGMNLGAEGPGGDRARLRRELDHLARLGVTNLRIVAGSEGPDSQPYRMVPALQPQEGIYNQEVFTGLDVLLAEMQQRSMRAIVCLNNFWQWSGGFAQYVSWAEGGTQIPYPPQAGWDAFEDYAARFFLNQRAQSAFSRHVAAVVNRVNSVNGRRYGDDPTIMTWQLVNEPRDQGHTAEYIAWMRQLRAQIRQLDTHHLITTGSEGDGVYAESNDYLTVHIWIQNWNWFDPRHPEGFDAAKDRALALLQERIKAAATQHKPLVLEEFGLARDGGDYTSSSSTTLRDRYYGAIFAAVERSVQAQQPLVGANFWAWSGEGRPVHPGGQWQVGEPWIGDPAHEAQGWYSIYDQDHTTTAVIQDYARRLAGESSSSAQR